VFIVFYIKLSVYYIDKQRENEFTYNFSRFAIQKQTRMMYDVIKEKQTETK